MVPMGAFIHNANLASLSPVTKTGELMENEIRLTAEEVMRGVIFLDVEPEGASEQAFKLVLPSTNSILTLFGPVLLTDGTWAREFKVVNRSSAMRCMSPPQTSRRPSPARTRWSATGSALGS